MQVRHMAQCALFTAVLALCAWTGIPWGGSYLTFQTFGIFLTLGLLGGKRGTITILVYLLLGAVGLPVFSGFRGGLGMLLGTTGGYLFGFLLTGLIYWLLEASPIPFLSMALGLLACYSCGSLWYMAWYLPEGTLWAVLLQCVVPYLVPDLVKLGLAATLTKRLKRFAY